MLLYNSLIQDMLGMLAPFRREVWPYEEADAWPDNGENSLILRRDTACELGSGRHAVGALLVSSEHSLIPDDRVELIGPDIAQVPADSDYARLTLACVSDLSAEENTLYHRIRDIDFTKFKVYPDGFMMRLSGQSHREQVCVGKDALEKGISLRRVGMNFIRQYKRNPAVTHVRQIFITDPAADYTALSELAAKADGITVALNHILEGLPANCSQCDLKPICDEVEGMREAHFKQSNMKRK